MNELAVFCLNDKAVRNERMYCHPGMYVYGLAVSVQPLTAFIPSAFLDVVLFRRRQVFDMTSLCRNTINASIEMRAWIGGPQQCLPPISSETAKRLSRNAGQSVVLL